MINADLAKKLADDIGISVSSVLLPKKTIDLQKWAVVACDQYTSEPEYWADVKEIVKESPSTLGLIFPEVYLESESEGEKTERIASINKEMKDYLSRQIFDEFKDTAILVERTFESGKTRKGLILSVDLERYDFTKGSQSLIRATEGTIIERLPPRIRVRENAMLELPHIMILIDDKDNTVIEPLFQSAASYKEAYSTELMKSGGSIKGWLVEQECDICKIYESLKSLASLDSFQKRYDVSNTYNVLLFAVGDGNHSLATAKACWENLKQTLTQEELENHPARFALVELVNLHDSGLEFEPIHRILFHVDADKFINEFCTYYNEKGCKAYTSMTNPDTKGHVIEYINEAGKGFLVVECPIQNLDVATLQSFLDVYLKNHQDTSIDYVHGDDVVTKLGSRPGNMGFFLSAMDKNELFKTVILDGALPRKTFSMGEAAEKRFYLEARKIK